jgi:hypothetical protein
MTNNNDQIIAFVVVMVIALVGAGIVLVAFYPRTPAAMPMILKADDLQDLDKGDWGQTQLMEFSNNWFQNSTSEALSWLTNSSVEIGIDLVVFKDEAEPKELCHIISTMDSYKGLEQPIGDESYALQLENSSFSQLFFISDRVLVWVSLHDWDRIGWNDDVLIFAKLQFEKIDQYLAQHPGAN